MMDGLPRLRRRAKRSGRVESLGYVMEIESDGTHEGKIPSRLLLGECPVLSHGWT